MEKYLKSIELDKVLDMLATETQCAETARRAAELRPSPNIEFVNAMLNQTGDAYVLLAKFGSPAFRGIKNVNGHVTRAVAGGVLNMKELLDIAHMLRGIRTLIEWRSHCEGMHTCLDNIFHGLTANRYLEDKIFSSVISEDEMADNASHTLYEIRSKIRETSSKIRISLDRMIRSSSYKKYLQEDVVTFRGGRFVVPVKSEYRANVPGLIHDTSATGATVFIEPESVVNLNNEIKILQGRESEEIERILEELSSETASFADHITASFENAVELDLIFAKAQLAFKMKASMPIVNNEGIIDIGKARHPLIDKNKVVPIDIVLGKGFSTLMVTGPNTGGKTVSIKTIGLFCAMTMCGLMLPCADESQISVFDKILVDIGDEQSIEQSLSTFSGHITNIISIMKQADNKSLVLIDELGAGTDPVEGAALAMAILEHLRAKGAEIAATTHYAEVKQYALDTDGVENACCEFDVQTLSPTYRLLMGVPGRSNAFAVSSRLGMEPSVIKRAENLVDSENRKFENVVQNLEKSRKEYEIKTEEARMLTSRARKDSDEAKRIKTEIFELRDKELEKARAEAVRITDQAKREANTLLEQLNALKKSEKTAEEKARLAKQKIKKSFGKLDDLTQEDYNLLDEEFKDYKLPRALKEGDSVYCREWRQKGVVIAPKNSQGLVEVRIGAMKTRLKEDSLVLADSPEKPDNRRKKSVNYRSYDEKLNSSVNNKCDLRGMTADEAIDAVDLFLDRAIMDDLEEVTIVHGKGTGVLRSAVQSYLKGNKRIKSYRLGRYGEGETGVTIVTLK